MIFVSAIIMDIEKMKALIIGATGATGKDLVHVLLQDTAYTELVIFVRRPGKITHPKLKEIVTDFEKPGEVFESEFLFDKGIIFIDEFKPISIILLKNRISWQLEYIHNNAVAAGMVSFAEEYKYSSAKFYLSGIDEFNIVTHYSGN